MQRIDRLIRPFHGRPAKAAAILGALAILGVYSILVLNRPWVLVATASYDDNLYVGLAGFLREGHWLGPYTEFTLAKPPGFSFFLAASSLVGLPFNLAVGAFQIVAASVFCYGVFLLSRSRALTVATFGLVLLSPQFFLLGRVLRETIYPFQILLLIGLLAMSWQSRRGWPFAALAGLVFGWVWITREDGIWLVPGMILAFALPIGRWRARIAGALLFLACTLVLPLTVGFTNQAEYGHWTVTELKDADFSAAISATQSVLDGGRMQGVAVTRSARQKIYEVSPTFAQLRPILEAPGYFAVACTQGVGVCGEIGNGWWHWAVRSAAWQLGYHPSAPATAEFYARVRRELSKACDAGTLTCGWRPVAALPTLTFEDFEAMPAYALSILSAGLLIDVPPPLAGYSLGEPVEIQRIITILNRPPAFQTDVYAPGYLVDPASIPNLTIFKLLDKVTAAYRLAYFATLALAAFLLVALVVKRRRPRANGLAGLMAVLLVLAASRIALLAVVGVSSFPTNTPLYMGPVYQILGILPTLFIAYAASLLLGPRRASTAPS